MIILISSSGKSKNMIEAANFAKKKLIDIFVNQNEYVKKDFAYREKNPSLFTNNIELLSE